MKSFKEIGSNKADLGKIRKSSATILSITTLGGLTHWRVMKDCTQRPGSTANCGYDVNGKFLVCVYTFVCGAAGDCNCLVYRLSEEVLKLVAFEIIKSCS
ncbi:hypothetical protein DPMN_005398 [Dreissena polymorpha]|uniref:Uncharacterized protein n=1 Tax=Dreissena polymorpha TaxID=45954 RepID=A0A9D4MUI8_DREPO|nr:hypothetical protein DPMN_005398 [Dreissena polymorpha]